MGGWATPEDDRPRTVTLGVPNASRQHLPTLRTVVAEESAIGSAAPSNNSARTTRTSCRTAGRHLPPLEHVMRDSPADEPTVIEVLFGPGGGGRDGDVVSVKEIRRRTVRDTNVDSSVGGSS